MKMKDFVKLLAIGGVIAACAAGCGKGEATLPVVATEKTDVVTDVAGSSTGENALPVIAAEKTDVVTDVIADAIKAAAETKTIKGYAKYRGLEITASLKDPKEVELTFTDTSSEGYSLGWANGPTITCSTTEGEYYYSVDSIRITAGHSETVKAYFDNAEGNIVSVSVSNVNMLNSRGLPEDFSGGDTVRIEFADGEDTQEDVQEDGNGNEQTQKTQERTLIEGTGDYRGLEIRVSAYDPQAVKVEYTNDTAGGYSLGWVDGVTVTCTTTEGEYYYASAMEMLNAGDSLTAKYYFDNAAGELQSVTISGINELDARGLPVDFSGGGSVTIDME